MTEEEKIKLFKKKSEEAAMTGGVIKPTAKLCKTCMHAYEDTQYTKGAEKANCYMFEPPDDKPGEVLWDGKDCMYYEKKEER